MVPLHDQVNDTLANTKLLIESQEQELYLTSQAVNRSVTHVENNEDARQACLISFNNGATTLNGVLSGMVTGAQLINNVIDVANRVKTTLKTDLGLLNRNIAVLDDWQPVMTEWANFVEEQTSILDNSQSKLQIWGDEVKAAINQEKISIIELGREVFNLETEILSWHDQLSSIGQMFQYTPVLLTVYEAMNGKDGETVYNPWS